MKKFKNFFFYITNGRFDITFKNFKKNPNRTYTQHTVSTKINLVDNLIKEICVKEDKETIHLALTIRDKIKDLLIIKEDINGRLQFRISI